MTFWSRLKQIGPKYQGVVDSDDLMSATSASTCSMSESFQQYGLWHGGI